MTAIRIFIQIGVTMALSVALTPTSTSAAAVGDAYAKSYSNSQRWAIGTRSIEECLEYRDGKLLLTSLHNKLVDPKCEYAASGSPTDLLTDWNQRIDDGSSDVKWSLDSSMTREVVKGGMPTVELVVSLKRRDIRLQYHIMAYPNSPILRQWWVMQNDGDSSIDLKPYAQVFNLGMNG
jgi:hypothetical protein